MAVKKGLGRGLDALIRPAVNKSAVSTEEKKDYPAAMEEVEEWKRVSADSWTCSCSV